jgi:hypothetical protein
MNDYVAMLRTQAESIMVDVIGMQVANGMRARDNPVYDADSFFKKAEELGRIADQINQAR